METKNEAISSLIEKVGLDAFSRAIGCHPTTAYRYAIGRRMACPKTVRRIRKHFGLSVAEIRPDLFIDD